MKHTRAMSKPGTAQVPVTQLQLLLESLMRIITAGIDLVFLLTGGKI